MTKQTRHEALLELVRTRRVTSQEELRALLHTRGFEVTQATVSRDIRELRLVKIRGAQGRSRYTLSEDREHKPPLERLLPALFLSAEGTSELLVVRTMTGGAQAVALAIDSEDWGEVLGTIAGDDTILIICRGPDQVEAIRERLEKIAAG